MWTHPNLHFSLPCNILNYTQTLSCVSTALCTYILKVKSTHYNKIWDKVTPATELYASQYCYTYSMAMVVPHFSPGKTVIAGWCNSSLLMHQSGKSPQTPNLTTLLYCWIQRYLPGGDGLNQHCENLFVKGMNITDIHLWIKVPKSSLDTHIKIWHANLLFRLVLRNKNGQNTVTKTWPENVNLVHEYGRHCVYRAGRAV